MGICRKRLRWLRLPVHRTQRASGLSILEVLITTVLISVGLTALLQFLLLALRMETRSERFWIGTIERWSRSQEIRSSEFHCDDLGEEFLLGEVEVDLRKVEVEGDVESVQRQWEILFTCRKGLHAD